MSQTEHHQFSRAIHWFMVLCVLYPLIMIRILRNVDAVLPYKPYILMFHKTFGLIVIILIACLTVAQLFFKRPRHQELGLLEYLAARTVQFGLYVSVLIMSISGYFILLASDEPIRLFATWHLPYLYQLCYCQTDFWIQVHIYTSYVLMGLITLHVSSAMFHHFVKHDGVLKGMLPSWPKSKKSDSNDPP